MARRPTQEGGGVRPGTTNFSRSGNSGPDRNLGSGNALPGNWQVSGPIATGSYNPDWNKGAAEQPPPNTGPSSEDLYWEQRAAQEAAERTARQNGVRDSVRGLFESFGLGSLYGKIEEYARQDYNADSILFMLRATPEYKARFPAMDALAKKGRAISEGQYIEYERGAANLEQRYGLANGMLSGHITELLTEEVGLPELNDRVNIAVADSIMAPQDLKDQLAEYFNLDPETALASYYLDPDIALPLLEKQSATARIGVWGKRQGVNGVGVDIATGLQEFGVTEAQAQAGFGAVKAQEGLGAGRGDTADQNTRIDANLKQNAGAQETVERAGSARVNRFAGGGSFAESKQGVGGLGSAAR